MPSGILSTANKGVVCSNFCREYHFTLKPEGGGRPVFSASWVSVKFFVHFLVEQWEGHVRTQWLQYLGWQVIPLLNFQERRNASVQYRHKDRHKVKSRSLEDREESNLFKSRQHINSKGLLYCTLFTGAFCWQHGTWAPLLPLQQVPFCCSARDHLFPSALGRLAIRSCSWWSQGSGKWKGEKLGLVFWGLKVNPSHQSRSS